MTGKITRLILHLSTAIVLVGGLVSVAAAQQPRRSTVRRVQEEQQRRNAQIRAQAQRQQREREQREQQQRKLREQQQRQQNTTGTSGVRSSRPSPLSMSASAEPDLKSLYTEKRYFELRDTLVSPKTKQPADLLFYRGVVSNKFNQPQVSISYLESYLKTAGTNPDPELLKGCYELLADNYVKTYQYSKAAEAYRKLLSEFGSQLDEEAVADTENSAKLWGALASVPPQSVTFRGDSVIKTSKDKIGLTNLPVRVNGRNVSFGFDTGANISTVTASFAARLGFKIIKTSIQVGSITGNNVRARLGIAPPMRIGNMLARNVVFLVLDDKDFFVPQLNHQINGIIGFPLIEGFREITFAKNGQVTIPAKPVRRGEQNMCLEELTPIIAGVYRGQRLAFSFDTGANTTLLNPPFYKAYEDEIKASSTPLAERIAGAGGFKEVTAYRVKDFVLTVSGKEARLAEVKLLPEETTSSSRYFYGNIGRDVSGQFEKMTINFEAMSIVFE